MEGGAIVSHDLATKTRIDNLKNFGITGEVTVVEPGINAKMNELQSAFGLLQLKEIDANIAKRKLATAHYRKLLKYVKGIRLLEDMPETEHNYSYFPIFINEKFGITRDALYEKLKLSNIFTRRYFYPLVSNFAPYDSFVSSDKNNLSNAHALSEEVLCLPISSELSKEQIEFIVGAIKN